MIKLLSLSRDEQKGVRTIEATFMVDGELKPLRVSEDDRAETFQEVSKAIETPGIDLVNASEQLFDLMSPEAMVNRQIKSSYHLSDNLRIKNGRIEFGEHVLEETLADHMLSMLDEDNLPKNERLWGSYIRFLDNLHQNVNEEIRSQLFRWMDYENKAGNTFAITEDGCIVGYKGCGGSILEPMSVFSGKAIVDGVDIEGQIPNRVGSVIQMPRATVQHDPSIGCAQGLHVGTRDYAVKWAPVLILVKVNPRDVVSVPYECSSQKIRVCEYTVMKVTDASEEHQMYYPDEDEDNYELDYDLEIEVEISFFEDEDEDEDEDYELTVSEANDLLEKEVYIEYDDGDEEFEGVVVNIFEDGIPGIVVKYDGNIYKHIKLHRISYYEDISDTQDDEDDFVIKPEDTEELLGEYLYVEYEEDSSFQGYVVDIYTHNEPGIIMKNEDNEYKHIKLNRINLYLVKSLENNREEEFDSILNYSQYVGLAQLENGAYVELDYRDSDGTVLTVEGFVLASDVKSGQLLINDLDKGVTIIQYEEVLSIAVRQ